MVAEYVDKVWRVVNPYQYQDYLHLLRYHMWREMQDFCLGDTQNQGTELLNSEETRISELASSKGGGRGETGDGAYAKQVFNRIWTLKLLRTQFVGEKILSVNINSEIDTYFNGIGFGRNTFMITSDSKMRKCATFVTKRLKKYLGPPDLIENKNSWIIKKGQNVLKRN